MDRFLESQKRAPERWLRFICATAMLLAVGVLPTLAQDGTSTFPSTEEGLDEMFPPTPDDAYPMSDPEPPPDIFGPFMPPPLADTSDSPVRDDRSLEQRIADSTKHQNALIERIRALLKQSNVSVVPPPSYELECNEDPVVELLTEQLVQSYVKQGGDPELGLLEQLITVRRELAMLGVVPGDSYQAQLANRLLVKAQTLIKTYGSQRDKVLAILGLAHKAANVLQLLGDSEIEQKFFSEIAGWLSKLVPDMLKDIRTQHDYRLVNAVFTLTRVINSSGKLSGQADPSEILRQIEEAMRFDLSLALDASGGAHVWALTGEFSLIPTLATGKNKLLQLMYIGEGQGTYASYTYKNGMQTMQAPDFPVMAKVMDFDPCKGTAVLFLDRFYAQEGETYRRKDTTDKAPIVWAAFANAFREQQVDQGFEFELPVKTKTEKAVDTVFDQSAKGFTGKFTVKLTHNPK